LVSNISSIPSTELSGRQRRQEHQQEQEGQLRSSVRDNTPGQPECADSLRNPSLIDDILDSIGDSSSADTDNIILLNAGKSHNIPDDDEDGDGEEEEEEEEEEGRIVRASAVLEDGANSSDNCTAVSMERSGVAAVNTSVGGVFFKTEPQDAGAESGGEAGISGGISKIAGSNGKFTF
jgi:hypothetical protein